MFKQLFDWCVWGMWGILGAFLLVSPVDAETANIGLGMPLPESTITQYSITVYPDGRHLPAGEGSVDQGTALYAERCAVCHGEAGIEGPAARLAGSDGFVSWSDPLRVLRIRKYPLLVLSVGAQWPYATSVFDYVRRAMPHYAPKSLTDDQVYALTAYILYINDLVDADTTLDAKRIMTVKMPGEARSVSAW